MTKNCYFMTMPKSRTIALLAYDGFQLLDVTGPVTVFAAANRELKHRIYDVVVVSPAGARSAATVAWPWLPARWRECRRAGSTRC